MNEKSKEEQELFAKSCLVLDKVVNTVVRDATSNIVDSVLSLDKKDDVVEEISKELFVELEKETFMIDDLSLTEKQKEVLIRQVSNCVNRGYEKYRSSLKQSARDEKMIEITIAGLKDIISTSITTVGETINRGVSIPATVLKCDVSKDLKKIELGFSGESKVTVPTRVVMIATNTYQALVDSVEYFDKK